MEIESVNSAKQQNSLICEALRTPLGEGIFSHKSPFGLSGFHNSLSVPIILLDEERHYCSKGCFQRRQKSNTAKT